MEFAAGRAGEEAASVTLSPEAGRADLEAAADIPTDVVRLPALLGIPSLTASPIEAALPRLRRLLLSPSRNRRRCSFRTAPPVPMPNRASRAGRITHALQSILPRAPSGPFRGKMALSCAVQMPTLTKIDTLSRMRSK